MLCISMHCKSGTVTFPCAEKCVSYSHLLPWSFASKMYSPYHAHAGPFTIDNWQLGVLIRPLNFGSHHQLPVAWASTDYTVTVTSVVSVTAMHRNPGVALPRPPMPMPIQGPQGQPPPPVYPPMQGVPQGGVPQGGLPIPPPSLGNQLVAQPQMQLPGPGFASPPLPQVPPQPPHSNAPRPPTKGQGQICSRNLFFYLCELKYSLYL